MSMCIRHGCDRKARPGMAVCEACLDKLLFGRVAANPTADANGRPGASTAPTRPPEPLSETEKRFAWGDR